MSVRLIGDHLDVEAAMVAEHHALLLLVDSPPRREDAGRVGAHLVQGFAQHVCRHDPEECAELESMLSAWAVRGRPADLWADIATAVEDHVERTESQHWLAAAAASSRSA